MSDSSPLSKFGKLIGRPAVPNEPTSLGRFQLKRILGKGAQSVVWLAFDPHLEREVAIKLMKVQPSASALEVSQWLQEARSVSRLAHANVVPLFEADAHGAQPYLVFEHVEGKTLSAVLRQNGAMPVLQAVALMIDVLDALVVAHAAGVIHRDLKPSNIMIDLKGRARVMDFGIAARASREDGVMLTTIDGGTPGYMSPEATQRGAASPLMDIFSAGIVLTEMLSGQALITEKNPAKAVQKVLTEQLSLPKALAPEANDALRAILLRAIQRDPQLRHPSAQLFRDELIKWSGLATGALGSVVEHPPGQAANSTLDFLLRRMRHKSDFPALSDSIVRIQGMASSETESIGSVTNEILKDVALTNKLLKLVNSAHFGGGGRISTVSRAVSLIGFNGIRNMALSLVLLEHMQDKAHANVLKEEFLRSLMAGAIASELSSGTQASEEAFIGTMFQNLGRLLAEFYFAEEAATVRTLVANPPQPVTEGAASASVLGMSYEALGLAVAKVWGLPEVIQSCIRKPAGTPPLRPPAEPLQRLRWLAAAANDVSDILLRTPAAQVEGKLAQVANVYASTLGVSLKELFAATVLARQKIIEMATTMDVKVQPHSAAARLLKPPPSADGGQKNEPSADSLDSLALHATVLEAAKTTPVKTNEDRQVAEILAAGIQDITNAMVEDFKLTDVLRMILETMFRAMDFQRVVFCMRDPKAEALTGRFGLGKGIETVAKAFVISLSPSSPDLLSAVCLKGADTMIGDASEARIASRLPAWYLKSVNAPTFLLLPLTIKTKPFGLIYADKAEKGGMVLDDKELALLRTLRNQAVMAFRQSS